MNRVGRFAAVAAMVLACVSGVQAVDIQTVTVGNPGNADDTHGDGYGGVDYVYNIGKFEVTAGQYRDFLNAVDPAGSNPYGLYNSSMDSSSYGCQITWNAGSSTYDFSGRPSGTEADWVERPVNYVSWGDAARFSNWLHNGQPTGQLTEDPTQDAGLTEDGSYYLNGATSNAALMAVVREEDASWVIPSEDEWYKAAYHYNDGVTGNYYDYPTSSDSAPVSECCPGGSNSANYNNACGPPYHRNDVGCYALSASPYGTFDQGGNVWEWNEAVFDGLSRSLRGGSFYQTVNYLHAAFRSNGYPTSEDNRVGFRVARVRQAVETVTVGNPGNADDMHGDGYGGVDYIYNIGKFEVTAGQYRDFLNAVDPAGSNPYGLYNSSMDSSSYGCQITWNAGSSTYDFSGRPSGTEADWVDRPVNYVSWGDAARFCNWLHNGQPTEQLTGDPTQDAGLTEDGSYYLNGATSNAELMAVVREGDATWVIPSEDEWYKAAYYDGGGSVYYDYPTSTDAVPNNGNPEGDTGNSANFDDGDYTIGSPYWRTQVGFFGLSESTYETFDQGGNVWEWNEAVFDGLSRSVRGGSFYQTVNYLHAAFRSNGYPTSEDDILGFRVARVSCLDETNPDQWCIENAGIGRCHRNFCNPDYLGPLGTPDENGCVCRGVVAGDVYPVPDGDGATEGFDILCILDAANDVNTWGCLDYLPPGVLKAGDIYPCDAPDGAIEGFDILSVLDSANDEPVYPASFACPDICVCP